MRNALVVMVMLSAASPVVANQAFPAPGSALRFGVLRPTPTDPYRKLFEPDKAVSQPAIANQPAARRKVVCGMTIIAADPKYDPSILRQPKADGIDYKIRAIDPPICNPAR